MAVVHALVTLAWYLILGALIVGGGYWLYRRARRAIDPETRTRRRLEAALRTRRTNGR
jgi:LPXTG-motif cell wall-anchored protein